MKQHIYNMLRSDNAVKIGVSCNVEDRRKNLSWEFSERISVQWISEKREDAETIESLSHFLLDEFRQDGEWFNVSLDEARNAVLDAIEVIEGEKHIELTPYQVVLMKFGGVSKLARAIGVKGHTTILRWKDKGFIPSNHQLKILRTARINNIDLTPAEIILGWPSKDYLDRYGINLRDSHA